VECRRSRLTRQRGWWTGRLNRYKEVSASHGTSTITARAKDCAVVSVDMDWVGYLGDNYFRHRVA
jgi:hypothetical protein